MSSAFLVAIAISTASIGPTSSLTYVRTMTDGITYPARIAATPGGGVYVTDPPMKLFAEYDAAGALVGTHAIGEGAVGIAVHTDGRIFISRDNGTIGVYNGTTFALLGTVNPAPLTLTGPNDLAFGATTSELYTVDSGSHRVLVFTESAPGAWTLARSWGMEGSGLGQFAAPQAIALNATLGQVIVTDADNFRIQVFNTTGILLFKFGYRTLYLPSSEIAWFARSEGVAVDACNNIYIVDALMGTVRVFSSIGKELSATFVPAVGYGTGAGQLREPCDVAIDGAGKMYVASTNNGTVEVFSVACAATASTTGPIDEPRFSRKSAPGDRREADGRTVIAPVVAVQPRLPDNPLEIVSVINGGEYCAELDLNRDNIVDLADLQIAVSAFGAGTVEDFWNMGNGVASNSHPALSPPHVLDLPNRCGRCHSMDGSPGGMLTAVGQENLCQSCHSAGKIAGKKWIGAGSLENSHPWNEDADEGVSDGPPPGSDLALHLDNGKIRCATCHDPHEGAPAGACSGGTCQGGPFDGSVCKNNAQCAPLVNFMREEIYHAEDLPASQGGTPEVHALRRMTVMDPTLCGECHTDIAAEWSIVGHAEVHADPWSHYDWSMGNNWLCTGPGTPYAYCTGEGVGTTSSPATAFCSGPGTPLACCTGSGTGTCTISNASCTGVQTPWQCCLGAGTGNCIANSACTGFQTPSLCCTGAGTGTCSNSLPAAMCIGAGAPEPCCSGPGAGSCSSREACRQCHSGNGYRDYSKDFPDGVVVSSTHRGSLRVIDCLVCHSTHGTSQDGKLLRIYDTVRLPTGQVFTGVGAGATCMACHNGRTVPPTNPSSVSTPHYLNGAAMLEGVNAVTTFPTGTGAITYTLSNSNHTTNAGLNCTTCHMAPGPTSGPEVGKVGGHTFRLKDRDTGYENVATTCNATGCHTGVTTINRTANGNYDGDATIEGIQDETSGLLGLLKDALYTAGAARLLVNPDTGLAGTEPGVCTGVGTPLACCTGVGTGPTCTDPDAEPANPYWTLRRCSGGTRNGLACNGAAPTAPFDCPGGGTCPQIVPTGSRTSTVINAIWNWEFVENSHDLGVKNTGYAIGLLQIAYKGVMGVAVPGASYRYTPAP